MNNNNNDIVHTYTHVHMYMTGCMAGWLSWPSWHSRGLHLHCHLRGSWTTSSDTASDNSSKVHTGGSWLGGHWVYRAWTWRHTAGTARGRGGRGWPGLGTEGVKEQIWTHSTHLYPQQNHRLQTKSSFCCPKGKGGLLDVYEPTFQTIGA